MKTNKLSSKVFGLQMALLNSYYVNFKIDLTNKLVIKLWHEALMGIDDDTFARLVHDYMQNNSYPPQSPSHLIQHLVDSFVKMEPSAEEAWNKVMVLRDDKQVKFWNSSVGTVRDMDVLLEMLKHDEYLGYVVAQMRHDFKVSIPDDQIGYVKASFIKLYNSGLEGYIRNNKLNGQLGIQIGTDGKNSLQAHLIRRELTVPKEKRAIGYVGNSKND